MKPMKYILVLCLVCITSISLSAKVENWDTFSEQKTAQSQPTRSQIVIVRPKELAGQAINIYIDGEYVSSLLPGAYTEEFVCSGKHRVNLAYTNVATRYKEKRTGGQWINFKSNHKQVYSLTKEANRLQFKHYPQNDVSKLLKKYTKKQSHTISRLNKRKCTQPAAAK